MKKLLVIFVLMFSASVLWAQAKVTKSDKVVKQNGKTYYVHEVKSGQTLYSISKAYDASIREISQKNDIISNRITVGQSLYIPVPSNSSGEKDFLWHRVKAGETVYSIAKKHGVSIKDIYFYNKRSALGIARNMILKIPNSAKAGVDFADDDFYYHKVISGNTLFSLSQQFGVSIEQIKQFNPELKHGLKAGQTIKIPKRHYDGTERLPVARTHRPDKSDIKHDPLYFEEADVLPCNRYQYKKGDVFEIAIMLPLYADNNLWVAGKYEDEDDKLFYRNSQKFIEMYEGILLALQQLKLQGLSLNVKFYDTKNSAVEMKKIIKQVNFSELDLIIGPVYSDNVKMVSHYAKKHKVNLISPLSSNTDLLLGNPFIFNVIPSDDMRVKKAADFMGKVYDSCIVIVHGGTPEEKKRIQKYKRKLLRSHAWSPYIDEIVIKTIDYNRGGAAELEKALSLGYINLILIPSENEVFVTKIVERLDYYTPDYQIKLFGSPDWEYFQNINLEHLHEQQFHYVSPAHIDYDYWKTQSFIRKFRNTYETEPSIYAFQGYDIMYYFGTALKEYGKNFQFCLSTFDKKPGSKGIAFKFDFARTGTYNGFENNGIFILSYTSDFKLKEQR